MTPEQIKKYCLEKSNEMCDYKGFQLYVEFDICTFDVKCYVHPNGKCNEIAIFVELYYVIPYDSFTSGLITNQEDLDKAITDHFHKQVDEYRQYITEHAEEYEKEKELRAQQRKRQENLRKYEKMVKGNKKHSNKYGVRYCDYSDLYDFFGGEYLYY